MKKNKLITVLVIAMLSVVTTLFYFAKSDNEGISVDSGSSLFGLGTAQAEEEVLVDGDLPEHTIGNIAKDTRSLKKQLNEAEDKNKTLEIELENSKKETLQIQKNAYKIQEEMNSLKAQVLDVQSRTVDPVIQTETIKTDILEELSSKFSNILPDNYQLGVENTTVVKPEVKLEATPYFDSTVDINKESFRRHRSITIQNNSIKTESIKKLKEIQNIPNGYELPNSRGGDFMPGVTRPINYYQPNKDYNISLKDFVKPANYKNHNGFKKAIYKPNNSFHNANRSGFIKVSNGSDRQEVIVDPRYTIFSNSILTGAQTVTSLVGRIPKEEGKLQDPVPFKIIVGSENLSANGFQIPNLDGMYMSGIAFGDSTLKCVRTKILSATYIFEDGRGITFPNKNDSDKNSELGWLSDDYGNPCIKGTLHTNKNSELRRSILIGSALGIANAYAENETTSSVTQGVNGTILQSIVSGDKAKYALGKGVVGGVERGAEFLSQQQGETWESVVIPSGFKVNVHIEKTLELDQTSIQRRVSYESYEDETYYTD